MDSDTENQQCTCELCQPNWHMGCDDDFFESLPSALVPEATPEVLRSEEDKYLKFVGATG